LKGEILDSQDPEEKITGKIREYNFIFSVVDPDPDTGKNKQPKKKTKKEESSCFFYKFNVLLKGWRLLRELGSLI
jgi:hypothetical protein